MGPRAVAARVKTVVVMVVATEVEGLAAVMVAVMEVVVKEVV